MKISISTQISIAIWVLFLFSVVASSLYTFLAADRPLDYLGLSGLVCGGLLWLKALREDKKDPG